MATWTRFYIHSSDVKSVTTILERLCEAESFLVKDFPENFHDSFLSDEHTNPNYLVFSEIQNGWITVLYNSFSKLRTWASEISDELKCIVIVSLVQTVSEYYYFSQYENGIKRREIEVCHEDGTETINYGEKYEFEGDKIGEPYEDDGEIEYFFSFESLEKYCQYFGLNPQEEWIEVHWTVLKGVQDKKTMNEFVKEFMEKNQKPWWKFW